jgi:hypothetical protein
VMSHTGLPEKQLGWKASFGHAGKVFIHPGAFCQDNNGTEVTWLVGRGLRRLLRHCIVGELVRVVNVRARGLDTGCLILTASLVAFA